jgi:hypothetical protein
MRAPEGERVASRLHECQLQLGIRHSIGDNALGASASWLAGDPACPALGTAARGGSQYARPLPAYRDTGAATFGDAC